MNSSIKLGLLALFMLAIGCEYANAQETKTGNYGSGIRLSVGLDGGLPIGSLTNAYNWTLGGSVQGDFPIVKSILYATIDGGYRSVFSKDEANSNNLNLIPVKAGLKYFFVKSLYFHGEAGAAFITNKGSVGADKSAAFLYSPQLGYLFNVGGSNYIDVGFRFEATTKFNDAGVKSNILALRVAYAFYL